MWRAGVGNDISRSLQRQALAQARIRYGAQALQPKCNREKRQERYTYRYIATRLLHVRKRARWTEGAGAHDAHILLCLHVGALRQQRLHHLQMAVLRGCVERRPSVLRRRRESRSAPPSMPTHARTLANFLSRLRSHTHSHARSQIHATSTQTYNDTCAHTRIHPHQRCGGLGSARIFCTCCSDL
jgi:hypothetical protein